MTPLGTLLTNASDGDEPPSDPGPAEYIRTCRHCGATLQPMRYETKWRIFYRAIDCQCEAATAERDEARAKDAAEERQHRIMQLLYSSGLEAKHYQRFSFKKWDQTRNGKASEDAYSGVIDYCKNVEKAGKNWVWLSGQYGLGKTHLAIAAVRAIAIKQMWHPHIIVWPELCQATQESWGGDGGETEGSMWGRARRAEILLIDDLDKTSTGEWAMGKLYGLINHRYERQLPTIITANKSPLQLKQLWQGSKLPHVADTGMAVLSRCIGQLWGVVEFRGNDQRMV